MLLSQTLRASSSDDHHPLRRKSGQTEALVDQNWFVRAFEFEGKLLVGHGAPDQARGCSNDGGVPFVPGKRSTSEVGEAGRSGPGEVAHVPPK